MSLPELLKEFDAVASECRLLLENEIRHHRTEGGDPDEAVLERKRELISRLDSLLGQLKEAGSRLEESPAASRDDLNHLQQKLMQVLRLDRELEKLLLASHVRRGPAKSDGGNAADSASPGGHVASRLYGKRSEKR
ncbi:MAG: hypothetical protein R6V45_01500 [Oceanipulchritudo sp.]